MADSPRSAVDKRGLEVRAGAVLVARDITEREQPDAALAFHASLLDNVDDGVIASSAGPEALSGCTASPLRKSWAFRHARSRASLATRLG
jgi:hypothetical protein